MIGRKKSKNPPYFSHEFVITNHGDIVSIIAMLIIVGLLHKGTHVMSSSFIFIQYNNTDEICVQYFFIPIKSSIYLFLTKVRLAKFNESAHLACFYALSTVWAIYSIINEGFILNLSSLWDDYPQRWMPFWIKLFFITQVKFFFF
ncbi:unnamed protein product [Trichobilharzia regenti]|nr:unnamed protein product [Trichobilharzia regenti]